jgi:hypothetical protein
MVAIVPSLSQLELMGDSGDLTGAPAAFEEFTGQLERVRQFIDDYLKTRALAGVVAVP